MLLFQSDSDWVTLSDSLIFIFIVLFIHWDPYQHQSKDIPTALMSFPRQTVKLTDCQRFVANQRLGVSTV